MRAASVLKGKVMKRVRRAALLLALLLLVTAQFATAPNAYGNTPAASRTNISLLKSIARDDQKERDQEGVTFDNLLATGSYTIYIEARNIGEHLRSDGLGELVEPLTPLFSELPRTFSELLRFITDNAETLSHSRLMIAASPAKSSLPEAVFALELDTEDAAEKFEPALKHLIFSIFTSALGSDASRSAEAAAAQSSAQSLAASMMIKRVGRLITFSLTPVKFKSLRPENERPMTEDANFRMTRDRFSSEAIFVYLDTALNEKLKKQRMEEYERERKNNPNPPPPQAMQATPTVINETAIPDAPSVAHSDIQTGLPVAEKSPDKSVSEPHAVTREAKPNEPQAQIAQSSKQTRSKTNRQSKSAKPPTAKTVEKMPDEKRGGSSAVAPHESSKTEPPAPDPFAVMMTMLIGGNFSFELGDSPEAIAAALTVESDSLIVRAMVLNGPGKLVRPIPFSPLVAAGPAQISEAPYYLPSDTDVFVSVSLDPFQIYDTLIAMARAAESRQKVGARKFELELAAFEKKIGFKLKDDLLAMIGNEVALGVPAQYLPAMIFGITARDSQSSNKSPLLLISIRNKEAVQSRLPALFEAIGFKLPNEKAQIEKRGEIEIKSYGKSAFAFINNFLIIGNDAAAIRRVIDARAKDDTLATNRDFHNYTQWQPRETVGQIYLSSAVVKGMLPGAPDMSKILDDETRDFLARYSFDPEPIAYAATPDAAGSVYELRVPKKLLMQTFATMTAGEKMSRLPRNEMSAQSYLHVINQELKSYKIEHDRFPTAEEFKHIMSFEAIFETIGYKFEIEFSGDSYTATATPIEYGKTGKLSFYTDQSGVIRQGDHGGMPASAEDKPADERNPIKND